MKLIYENLPSRRTKCVATIGVFDGIHCGHLYILKQLKNYARKHKAKSLVITFDRPPQIILKKPFDGCITNFPEKIDAFKKIGVDYLWMLKASSKLLQLSGDKFIDYIMKYFDIHTLIVGEDFRFGYGGSYTIGALKELASRHGFNIKIIKKRKIQNKIVSSSYVRTLIKQGNLKKADKMLGRSYALTGKVVKGKGVGSKLGFPTANINVCNRVVPSLGVYAGFVQVGKKTYKAAVNIGYRPTLEKKGKVLIEAYIIGLRKSILGKTIAIGFLDKLREEKRFSSTQKLAQAISQDIDHIRFNYSIPA